MKLLLTTISVCALALVASVRAQDDANNPNKKKHQGQGQGQGQAVAKQPQTVTRTNRGGGNKKGHQNLNANPNANAQSNATVQGSGKHHGKGNGNGGNANANNAGNANNTANAANNTQGHKGNKGKGKGNNANNANSVNNAANANNANNVNQTKANKHLSKQELKNSPEWQSKHQKAQAIHQQHLNFKAQQNQSIASAQFNKNYKIQNAQNWKGNQYVVFKNYHPQWHDQGWWHNHYHDNVFLFAGGWYFWNAGYYYPAWGYNSAEAYYPYDGPIYAGQTRQPLDQTIADVQASLQEQGFYKGEVDGLMGPLTRAALAEYQQSQGLEATAAMDEPTLESLGMA